MTLQNVRFQVGAPDLRPAIILDGVDDCAISGLSVQGNQEAESTLRFVNSKNVLLTAARVLSPAAVFLRLEGAESGGISIDGGDLSRAKSPLAFEAGAVKSAVKLRS